MIVDIVIQEYAIRSIYGWSIHLLGAIWSSVSHLLIRIAEPKENPVDIEVEEKVKLLPIKFKGESSAVQGTAPYHVVPEEVIY